jgi:hypothetical protein
VRRAVERKGEADCLSKAGLYAEAEALLPEVRSLFREVGTYPDELRLEWTAGLAASLTRTQNVPV